MAVRWGAAGLCSLFPLWGSWTSCWAASGRVYGRLNPNLVGGQLGALLAAGLECGVCPPAARLLPFLTERALVSCLPGRKLDRPSNCVK